MNRKISIIFVFLFFALLGCNSDNPVRVLERASDQLTINSETDETLVLPTSVVVDREYEAKVSWSSSDKTIMTDLGIVFRSDVDQQVTLTATLSFNGDTTTKEFDVTVKKLASSERAVTVYSNDEIYNILYYELGSTLAYSDVPTMSKADFLGWYISDDFAQPVTENTQINDNIEIYAKWDIRFYELNVVYSGHEEFNQTLEMEPSSIANFSLYMPADGYQVTSVYYDDFDNAKTIVDFDWNVKEHTVYVELSEKIFGIRYYDETDSELVPIATFESIDQAALKYVISEDNYLYEMNIQKYPYAILIAYIPLSETDSIELCVAFEGMLIITTEEGKIYTLNRYPYGTYFDQSLKDVSYLNDYIGGVVRIETYYLGSSMVIVGTKGYISFNIFESTPYTYTFGYSDNEVAEVFSHGGRNFILSKNGQLYSDENRYESLARELGFSSNEFVDYAYQKLNELLLFTSEDRLKIINEFNLEYDDFDLINDLGFHEGETVIDIQNNYLLTSENRLFRILVNSEDNNSFNNLSLIDIFESGDYIKAIVDTDELNSQISERSMLFVSQQGYLYYSTDGVLARLSDYVLGTEETILYFYNDIYSQTCLITDQSSYYHDFFNGEVDNSKIEAVLTQLASREVNYFYYEPVADWAVVTTNDYQSIDFVSGIMDTGYVTVYQATSEEEKYYGDPIYFPISVSESGLFMEYVYGSQYTYVCGNEDVFTHLVPWKLTINFVTNSQDTLSPISDSNYREMVFFEPSKTGYTFAGWYMDESLTIPFSIDLLELGNEYNLYAKWE